MFKKSLLAAIVLPFMIAPALAQNNNAHHYQGGPKTSVPHHMTDWPRSKETTAAGDQSGQHHYQGGPKAEPHHVGNLPGTAQKTPKASKKQKRNGHRQHSGSQS